MRPESVGAADGGDAARRSTSHRRHLPDGCFHSCGRCGCIFSGAYASSQAASSERHTAQIASTEENPAREAVAVRTHTRRAGGYSGGPRGRLADPSGGALHRSLLAPLPFFSSVSMAAGSGLCLLAVALLAAAWISDGSSSNKQAHSNQQYVNCMPCSRTYVADAYVGALTNQLSQHHDLTEVPDTADLFKGLAGELDVPTLSEVNRQLVGEGSHRRLIYSAKFANSKDAMVKFLDGYDANLVIIEKLPSGVFADPFELQHFVERKGFAVDCVCFQHR